MTEPIGQVGPPMMCARCGIRLNTFERWQDGKLLKVSWEHTALKPDGWEEHPVEPIMLYPNASPPVGFCDFCNAQDPTWSFPAAPFKIDTGIPSEVGYGSADNWAACEACHDDIEANDWAAVHKRYFSHKAVPKFARSVLKNEIEGLHRQFRLHRLGAPFRVR